MRQSKEAKMRSSKTLRNISVLLLTTFLLSAFSGVGGAAVRTPAKTFVFFNSIRNLNQFRGYCKITRRLKQYGSVEIDLGTLADKGWYQIPKGARSDWHEYGVYDATIAKFFPDPTLAPFLPAQWVAKNRDLLLAKAAILRDYGLEAAFSSNDTEYLPEAFFRRYPQLRGPRVDHPRRSVSPEFSYCVDVPETLHMIERMVAKLKRNVPEIQSIFARNNDEGTGLCWSESLYAGPNGPDHCKNRNMGLRVRGLLGAMERGAQEGGCRISIRLEGNFSRSEQAIILPHLPRGTYLGGPTYFSGLDPTIVELGSEINNTYPVLGVIDPLSILTTLQKAYSDPKVHVIVVNTDLSYYHRADESLSTLGKIVEIMQDYLDVPNYGLMGRLGVLRHLAARWGGKQNADKLLEAFYQMHEAFRLIRQLPIGFSPLYAGVSTRMITRPLVIAPDLLTPQDENYFLPYIFNIHTSEARNDYTDIHGGEMAGPRYRDRARFQDIYRRDLDIVLSSARTFENIQNAPEHTWLRRLALSLRMWVSIMRSIDNFYFAQLIRNRHRKALAGHIRIPPKVGTWTGAPDFVPWMQLQRDELDNTNELIGLLQNGGLDMFAHADTLRYEDTFLLGPDIIDALREKYKIMLEHWLDAQDYLTPPFK